jgi:hypothetical protein
MTTRKTRVDGTSHPHENPFERGTTRGRNEVEYPTSPRVEALKECSCEVCGVRTYTVDGTCGNRGDILHAFDPKGE